MAESNSEIGDSKSCQSRKKHVVFSFLLSVQLPYCRHIAMNSTLESSNPPASTPKGATKLRETYRAVKQQTAPRMPMGPGYGTARL